MLTRDLISSRNLSQTFAVSRSRPICVAVVIVMEKPNSTIFPQMCIICGNPFCPKASRFGVLARAGMMPEAPDIPRGTIRFAGTNVPLRQNCVGFSRTVFGGASEKCAKASTNVHMPFTTFPQELELCKYRQNSQVFAGNSLCRNLVSLKLHRNCACWP